MIETSGRFAFLSAQKARKADLEALLAKTQAEADQHEVRLKHLEEARNLTNLVALATQQEITGLIEEVVSLALASVYGPRYSFGVETTIKNNRPQFEFYFMKGKLRLNPRGEQCGGGVLDVASFGLRMVLWSLMMPRAPALMILDEPFRFVRSPGHNLLPRVAEMVREISQMLGIQVIMASHNSEFSDAADSTHVVALKDDISTVKKSG